MTEVPTQPSLAERHPSGQRTAIDIFGLRIDRLTMDQTVRRVDELIAAGGVHQHVSVNVDKVVKAHRDPGLRAIVNAAALVSADGQPIVWASHLLGQPLPERVTGIDLMERLIARAESAGHRLYFLGARRDVVTAVVRRVHSEHPGATIAGARDGYWRPQDEPLVAEAIAAAKPDILFVALPSPAKERFLDRWKHEIGAGFVIGVGGSFDVYGGLIPRAPHLVRRLGFEWLHRLTREPRRMWRRYLVDDLRFVPIVAGEWIHARRHARRTRDAAGG
jgi:N-acetylglucosaminyldiphosphoundecaprenol N-acetyl-beta-D-mannosaminyltransferase